MSYELKTSLLPVGHRLRPGGNFRKTSITIHSTGNLSSTPQGERNWLNNATNKRYAAWHYVIGEGLVIQAIPDNETAWHCGTSEGNNHSVGIEIVESGDRCKVLMTAAEFTADLMRSYGFGVDNLRRHYDWTKKDCPRILINPEFIKGAMNWQWFLKTVHAFLNEDENNPKIEKINMIVNGNEKEVRRILVNDSNYVNFRDLAGALDFEISFKGSIPIATKK